MRKKTILFVLSLGIALLLTFLLKEPQFTDSQVYVLFLLFFSIGLWLTEAIPPFSVGLFILAFIMSNTATSTVLIPLGMAILPEHKTEVALITGLAASTALFLPVSTPPNAIAYITGMVEQKDLRIGGILVGLLGPAVIILWVLLIS